MPIELQGQLERITYHNEENHYTIAKLKVKGQRDLVTIVGCLVSMTPGEVLRLKGEWDIASEIRRNSSRSSPMKQSLLQL